MPCRRLVLFCALALLLLAPAQAQSRGAAAYGRLPMHFEQNLGQTDPRVRFVARGAGYAFFLTDTESVAVLQKHATSPAVIRMQLLGASRQPHIEGDAPFAGKSNYLLGSDPSKWRTDVPQFGRVRMSEVYRGIDVVYYGNQSEIEYDFLVAPGSDPRQIRMRFEGAERITIDASGDLILRVAEGELRQRAPFAYQERGGARHAVPARYRRLGAREFGIALGAYDSTLPLVIDPVLAWSTYLGGSFQDAANGITVDLAGNAYVTGSTASANFPTANALQAANAGASDAFVTKLDASGTALIYATYLGGSGNDAGNGIALDLSANAYVAGFTHSTDFPTVNPIQAAQGGEGDGFVTKLNAAGNALVYSTYLGGSTLDVAFGIDVDISGDASVAGHTLSTNFPTANAIQAAIGGSSDAFVTKLNAAGTAFIYSTYLGGSAFDIGFALAIDAIGSAYVAGYTGSTNFPVANALQAVHGGADDAFVTKLNPAGTALVYSTYLGGLGNDVAGGIAVDAAQNVHVAGHTSSNNFPTANALQASLSGFVDAFATRLNAAGTALIYSTYLGGIGTDFGIAIAVDGSGNASLTGSTNSPDFPTVNAVQAAIGGGNDAFATSLDPAGVMVASTYLGGAATDGGQAVAVSAGSTYIAGLTTSADFPTVTPLQASFGGIQDAFVAQLAPPDEANVEIAKSADSAFVVGQDSTFTITVTNHGPDAATDVTVTDTIPAGATFVSATPTQGSCSAPNPVICTLGTLNNGASAIITLIVRPTVPGLLSNTATVSSSTADSNPADNTSTALVQVAGAPGGTGIPALDGKTLMLLAALLATAGMWMVGRKSW